MKSITIDCPDKLHDQLEKLVKSGWVKNQQAALIEASQRFLDSHYPELQERQIIEDVTWGLKGNE